MLRMLYKSSICLVLYLGLGGLAGVFAEPIEFADDGGLKMIYDNRMYPQAVTQDGHLYMVWRGSDGLPYIRSYDLSTRQLGEPYMLLTGRIAQVDKKKYKNNHHFSPVIWADKLGRLHVFFGGHHSYSGIHLVANRGEMREWSELEQISTSVSYPKIHRIDGGRTLIYFRDSGHLGSWRYQISSDAGETWEKPATTVVDMDAFPHDSEHASYAGSYHTTQVGVDGKTLHVAFILKIEKPVFNTRYGRTLDDYTRRHNLYYLKVDLSSGRAFNANGKEVELPVRKSVADRDLLVWDTQERVAAVGPSIYVDVQDEPFMLLPVSDKSSPHRSTFYFVQRGEKGVGQGQWIRTPITSTPHPFNASHLTRGADGRFLAYLITGEGENSSNNKMMAYEWLDRIEEWVANLIFSSRKMDAYGWGDRIEEWVADDSGENWKLVRDLSPENNAIGWRYQNVKFVARGDGLIDPDMLIFYGWESPLSSGRAYLMDWR